MDSVDGNECFIQTSCSQALVVADQFGPFIVASGTGCKRPPSCIGVKYVAGIHAVPSTSRLR